MNQFSFCPSSSIHPSRYQISRIKVIFAVALFALVSSGCGSTNDDSRDEQTTAADSTTQVQPTVAPDPTPAPDPTVAPDPTLAPDPTVGSDSAIRIDEDATSTAIEYREDDLSLFDSPDAIVVDKQRRFTTTCEAVFATFSNEASWETWVLGAEFDYLAGQTEGVGTTRIAHLMGSNLEEKFFVWQQDQRVAFTVVRGDNPLFQSFVEDLQLTPGEGDMCDLRFRVALDLVAEDEASLAVVNDQFSPFLDASLDAFVEMLS